MINLIVNGNSYSYPQPGDKANTGWGSQGTNWASAVTAALTSLGLGGTLTPTPNTVIDISSTTKGILVPRLTTTQRNAITSPATSLLIFNTTLGVFQYYTGSAWITIGAKIPDGGVTAGNGSAANPSYGFSSELSGLYRESAGVLAISVLGSKQLSIDSNGYFLKSNNVSGHFERTSSYSGTAILPFDTAIINNTNYNTGTGRFTSPVAGTYLFYVQGIGQVSNRIGVYFRKNGNQYTYGISSLNDLNGGTGAQTAIMQLNAGEYMDVYANYPGTFTYSKSCFFGFFLIG